MIKKKKSCSTILENSTSVHEELETILRLDIIQTIKSKSSIILKKFLKIIVTKMNKILLLCNYDNENNR